MKVPAQKTMNRQNKQINHSSIGAIKGERKIVQIAVSEAMTYDDFGECIRKERSVLALCNDGTLWERGKMCWIKFEDIPQD